MGSYGDGGSHKSVWAGGPFGVRSLPVSGYWNGPAHAVVRVEGGGGNDGLFMLIRSKQCAYQYAMPYSMMCSRILERCMNNA